MKYKLEQLTEEENDKVQVLRKSDEVTRIKKQIKKLSLLEKLSLFVELDNDGSAVALSWIAKFLTKK